MRGLDLLYIPTTLLAMADSSIGGKGSVNFKSVKNLLGIIKQPAGVLTDFKFLKTLDKKEIVSGLGEILKLSVINEGLMLFLEKNDKKLLTLSEEEIAIAVCEAIRIKSEIVVQDEYDKATRRVLNIGHTIGHAIEAYDNYKLTHGEYILMGLCYEVLIANNIGVLDKEYLLRLMNLINKYYDMKKFALRIKNIDKLVEMCAHDKKNNGGEIAFILPVSVGKVKEHKLSKDELKKILNRILVK
jgi:3-dehydroquinate synthase